MSMYADCDVLIVGAGPVGLLAALALEREGIESVVIERDLGPSAHSRAIGIHPPALEILDQLGLADPLIERGVAVTGGRAFGRTGRELGRLGFDGLEGPFKFALTCPQGVTEETLEAALEERLPGAVHRGMSAVGVDASGDRVSVEVVDTDGTKTIHRTRFLIGADGHGSVVRDRLGIHAEGASYPDSFVMGDFEDNTTFSTDAALFLHGSGLVESFPLPGGVRRWVASIGPGQAAADPGTLARLVDVRAGHSIGGLQHTMLGRFRVHRFLADRFTDGPVALIGDAAHVMSPIGGQGMNVGWMDAKALATSLSRVITADGPADAEMAEYGRSRRRAALIAIRRAERNMALGLGGWWNPARDLAVRTLLRTPAVTPLAKVFTMRGLDTPHRFRRRSAMATRP